MGVDWGWRRRKVLALAFEAMENDDAALKQAGGHTQTWQGVLSCFSCHEIQSGQLKHL
jgi:hypothetical protein